MVVLLNLKKDRKSWLRNLEMHKGEEGGGGGGIVLAVFLKDISGQLFRRQGCIS